MQFAIRGGEFSIVARMAGIGIGILDESSFFRWELQQQQLTLG